MSRDAESIVEQEKRRILSTIPASKDSQRITNLLRVQPKSTTYSINETNIIEGKRIYKQVIFTVVREELLYYSVFYTKLTNATIYKKQRLYKKDLLLLLRF